MLTATKTSAWKKRIDIAADGQWVAAWDPSLWLTGGTVVVDGQPFRVRNGMLGSTFTLQREDGAQVATARKAGRKNWSIVTSDGTTYEFRRTSIWGTEQEMLAGGQRVGSVRKAGFWRTGATADLPGMPLPLQVFTLAVIMTMWARDASAAAGGASAAAVGGAASS